MDNEDKIKEAAKSLKTITFSYTDSNGGTSEREIEPYEFRGEGFYGYDISKSGIRLFKLGQMDNVVVTNNTYSPRFPVLIN